MLKEYSKKTPALSVKHSLGLKGGSKSLYLAPSGRMAAAYTSGSQQLQWILLPTQTHCNIKVYRQFLNHSFGKVHSSAALIHIPDTLPGLFATVHICPYWS